MELFVEQMKTRSALEQSRLDMKKSRLELEKACDERVEARLKMEQENNL